MVVTASKLSGVFEIALDPRPDDRGLLTRLYDEQTFRRLGLSLSWVQESHIHTFSKHTLRGIHVALPPALEAKLIAVIRGVMLWVVVDLRAGKTFGQWATFTLSSEKHNLLYVPRGFGHGCLSLTDGSDLVVRADNYFSEEHGTGIVWNDPDLKIDWQLTGAAPIISERDRGYPTFREFRERYGCL